MSQKFYGMKFSKVYPLYVQKAERKNRTKEEIDQIICWLTGYDQAGLQQQLDADNDFETFFAQAPAINPNCSLIKGVVCGVRVEEIEDPLIQKVRYLDKLIDELAKGKTMEKILRQWFTYSNWCSSQAPWSEIFLLRSFWLGNISIWKAWCSAGTAGELHRWWGTAAKRLSLPMHLHHSREATDKVRISLGADGKDIKSRVLKLTIVNICEQ